MVDELISQFSPAAFSEWCREKFDRFTADPHTASDAGDFAQAEIVGYVQSLPDGEANRPLLVMAIHAGEQINERSSRRRQFDFARKQLQAAIDKPPAKVKGLFTQGLFAFYDNAGAFRLSLVSGRADGKRLGYSDFKRQSFFVTVNRNKTFRSRMKSPFGTYQDLAEAFSVEALTKEFYNRLFAWYERAMAPESKITFPNDLARDDDDRNLLAEHLIRLITRLMFVWFIRQKNLVPPTLFDVAALKQILKDFNPLSSKQDNYYRAILQNLFFATLNCEIVERKFAPEVHWPKSKEHFGIKLLYRYPKEFACPEKDVIRLFSKVPFLNGGLFECLDKDNDYQDGFSRNDKRRAHIPNALFFDDTGLITLFSLYDFTVDENAPNDADVALDPELLGKVFENLLGAYNPETQDTARKQSGSFYTPREIVNYMVDESLVAHLRTQVPEVEESAIRLLLGEENLPDLPESIRRKLVEALYHCRILDPACGSGAFPMGLLLKMVHLLQRLDPKNTLWHEVVMAETERALAAAETLSDQEKTERRKRITDSFEQSVNEPDYARKLYLIENCIFGVDIQSIAVQIAKLRAFITLVCDQTPTADAGKNYGMLPLPNLETKFVAANSLIGLASDFADGLKSADGISLLNDDVLHRLRAELADVRHRHFRARTAPEKNKCRKLDDDLRGKIKTRLVELASKPDAEKIALWRTEIEKFQQQRQAVEKEDWRDVVQAKPTQGDMFEQAPPPVQTVLRLDVNKEQRDRIDSDIRRLTRSIEAEEYRARNKSAFQKEADRLASWDPYDQNASSPFFDPQWMFDVRSGFDIVIGNPPYGFRSVLSKDDKVYYRKVEGITFPSGDSAELFVIKTLKNHVGAVGSLTFIIPKKSLYGESWSNIRQVWLTNSLGFLMDASQAFENVLLEQVAFLISKNRSQAHPVTIGCLDNTQKRIHVFGSFTRERILSTDGRNAQIYRGLYPVSLLEKIKSRSVEDTRTILKAEIGISNITQDLTLSPNGNYPCLKGIDLLRYGVKPTVRYLRGKVAQEYIKEYSHQKIVSQKIVAHLTKPMPHILLALTWDTEKRLLHDTCVEIRVLDDRLKSLFVLAYLQSAFISWYAYNLVYNRACRTMDFINYYVTQLPFPQIVLDNPMVQNPIVDLAHKIIVAKKADFCADTSKDEIKINVLVYKLYGLIDKEIAIVEGREASTKRPAYAAKPAKPSATRKPRKSVMVDDPGLA